MPSVNSWIYVSPSKALLALILDLTGNEFCECRSARWHRQLSPGLSLTCTWGQTRCQRTARPALREGWPRPSPMRPSSTIFTTDTSFQRALWSVHSTAHALSESLGNICQNTVLGKSGEEQTWPERESADESLLIFRQPLYIAMHVQEVHCEHQRRNARTLIGG